LGFPKKTVRARGEKEGKPRLIDDVGHSTGKRTRAGKPHDRKGEKKRGMIK